MKIMIKTLAAAVGLLASAAVFASPGSPVCPWASKIKHMEFNTVHKLSYGDYYIAVSQQQPNGFGLAVVGIHAHSIHAAIEKAEFYLHHTSHRLNVQAIPTPDNSVAEGMPTDGYYCEYGPYPHHFIPVYGNFEPKSAIVSVYLPKNYHPR